MPRTVKEWAKGRLERLLKDDYSPDIVDYVTGFESQSDLVDFLGALCFDENAVKRFAGELFSKHKGQSSQAQANVAVDAARQSLISAGDGKVQEQLSATSEVSLGGKAGSKGWTADELVERSNHSRTGSVTFKREKKRGNKGFGNGKKGSLAAAALENGGVVLPGRRRCDCQATRHPLISNCQACGRIICEQEGEGECMFCTTPVYKDAAATSSIPITDDESRKAFLSALDRRDQLLNYQQNQAKRTIVYDDQGDYFESSTWLTEEERERNEQLIHDQEQQALNNRPGQRPMRKVTLDFAGRSVIFRAESDDEDGVGWGDDSRMVAQVRQDMETQSLEDMTAQHAASSANSADKQHTEAMEQVVAEFQSADLNSYGQSSVEGMRVETLDSEEGAGAFNVKSIAHEEKALWKGGRGSLINSTLTGRTLEIYQSIQSLRKREEEVQSMLNAKVRVRSLREGGARRVQDATAEQQATDMLVELERRQEERAGPSGAQSISMPSDKTMALLPGVMDGVCLSMHQPWASLLVHGIKLVEGREWSTQHRGALWIASTAKAMDIEEGKQLIEAFKKMYPSKTFPSSYPPGTLLGCVNLQSVQDKSTFESESMGTIGQGTESKFAWLIDRQHALPKSLQPRISGKPKLWELERGLVEACAHTLQPIQ